ncbi:MAG: inositol-3-phosphate synthase [Erythrobacter sp.]|uniref:inositol-3-phosphate synthase n=1 Tax=Erythrobacter sp. TaxID=1042 RepID=UPI00260EE57A|nr:inositol-3-phosphate synthase [Erythrobacter sp.]MDJ0979107.1 inositol-3-phosphate synthase [Erythrobacter sp.]
MTAIRIAVVGIGNCASSLVQGVAHYRRQQSSTGLIQEFVGDYAVGDIDVVLGIDVDERKVGRPLGEAIFAKPNNTKAIESDMASNAAPVIMGKCLDGVSDHMRAAGERGFVVCNRPEATQESIVAALREHDVDVLVNFLPVGSQDASEFYMNCALEARVGVVNSIPVFIASDPEWDARFRERGLPIVGDDIKAQVGATIVHRILSQLFALRGVGVDHTYQLNTGGNTDFINMMDRSRIDSKKVSKTDAVQSALAARLEDDDIVIGPSEYVPWQKDNKICFLRLEGQQFGGIPMNLELRLSVEDSPNAAACVVDAIRYCRLAMERGMAGALTAPSAFYCKHPPVQMPEEEAERLLAWEFGAFRCAAE